jgi:hypothetical protein
MVVLFSTLFLPGLETDVRSFRYYKSRLSAMVFHALCSGWTERIKSMTVKPLYVDHIQIYQEIRYQRQLCSHSKKDCRK